MELSHRNPPRRPEFATSEQGRDRNADHVLFAELVPPVAAASKSGDGKLSAVW